MRRFRCMMALVTTVRFLAPLAIVIAVSIFGYVFRPQLYEASVLSPKQTVFQNDPDDIYIVSTYYYPKSKSLGDNAVALVLSAHYDTLNRGTIELLGVSETDNVNNATQCLSLDISFSYGSAGTEYAVVEYDVGIKVLSGGGAFMLYLQQVPFQTVSYKKREVVTCISPLFANEQWQYLVFAAHLYKRFGSYMHLYIRSIVEPVYKLMLEYQKEGYLTIEPWLRLNLSTIPIYEFNPNINVEFRNQAAAQTDCLLKYKESAMFISFMDLDDILIPRLANTYFEEFEILFNMEQFKEANKKLKRSQRVTVVMKEDYDPLPKELQSNSWWKRDEKEKEIAFLHFSKENIHVEAHYDPKKFSLIQMFSSINFMNKNETGKMVTRPQFFNHTWIHWPIELPKGFIRYDVPPEKNVITHLKTLEKATTFFNKGIVEPQYLGSESSEQKTMKPLISKEIIEDLQGDLDRMKTKPSIAQIWSTLPQKLFYLDIVTSCFNHTFYRFHYGNRFDKIKCPGPDRCRLPQNPGISCANAHADFFSTTEGEIINVHYSRHPRFSIEDGCIP